MLPCRSYYINGTWRSKKIGGLKPFKDVYRFQTLNPNSIEYIRFINCCGKANKKRISWHIETYLGH